MLSTSSQLLSAARKSRLNLAMPPTPPKPSVSNITTRRLARILSYSAAEDKTGGKLDSESTRKCRCTSLAHPRSPLSESLALPPIQVRTGVVNPVFGRIHIEAGSRLAHDARSVLVGGLFNAIAGPRRSSR